MGNHQAVLSAAAESLDGMLNGSFDIAQVAGFVESLDAASRLSQLRALSKHSQAALYEAAKGVRRVRLTDLVPSEVPELRGVVHHGKNSMPLFSNFELVLCRPKRDLKELWGFNRTGRLVERTVGPGYFVAYEGPGDEMLLDYTRVPDAKPEGWPDIISNKNRFGRLVYGDMIDALRGVSEHLSVGRAMRGGKVLDHWFVVV